MNIVFHNSFIGVTHAGLNTRTATCLLAWPVAIEIALRASKKGKNVIFWLPNQQSRLLT